MEPGTDAGAAARRTWDTASSEPLHPAARETLLAALDQAYADPRARHRAGRNAHLMWTNAREAVAQALDVRPEEVTFTASGTDAVHRGLLGLARGHRRTGQRLVHGAVEHSAVLHASHWAERPTTSVPVTRTGRVTPAALAEALDSPAADGADDPPPPGVVAVQTANHEVGTVQPVAELAEVAHARGVGVFTDAAASAGRTPLPTGWDIAAASAHKWGGPAGVGVLLVRKRARWRPPFPADDRLDERASGFDNVPGALAAAAALQAVVAERETLAAHQHRLVQRLREGVAALPDVEVTGEPDDRLPHLLTFSCLYVDGEALVDELDRRGFGVASGSACTATTLTPSHVLEAMGVLTHGNVRLSLTRDTTDEDVTEFLQVLPEVLTGLRERIGMA